MKYSQRFLAVPSHNFVYVPAMATDTHIGVVVSHPACRLLVSVPRSPDATDDVAAADALRVIRELGLQPVYWLTQASARNDARETFVRQAGIRFDAD